MWKNPNFRVSPDNSVELMDSGRNTRNVILEMSADDEYKRLEGIYAVIPSANVISKENIKEFKMQFQNKGNSIDTFSQISLAVLRGLIKITEYILTYFTPSQEQLNTLIEYWIKSKYLEIGPILLSVCTMRQIAKVYHSDNIKELKESLIRYIANCGRFDMCEYIFNTTKEFNFNETEQTNAEQDTIQHPNHITNLIENNFTNNIDYKLKSDTKSYDLAKQPGELTMAIKYNADIYIFNYISDRKKEDDGFYQPDGVDVKHIIRADSKLLLFIILTSCNYFKLFDYVKYALDEWKFQMASVLIKNCRLCDFKDKDPNGNTLFHLVAASGKENLAELLFSTANTIYNNRLYYIPMNYSAETPIFKIRHDSLQIFHMFNEPINLYNVNNCGVTPLHYFAKRNLSEIISSALVSNDYLASKRDDNNLRPIHYACQYGSIDAIKLLLCKETPENTLHDFSTPLFIVLNYFLNDLHRCLIIVKCLLKHPSVVNSLYSLDKITDKTSLHFAIYYKMYDIVAELVKYMPRKPIEFADNEFEYSSIYNLTSDDRRMNNILSCYKFK